jgi:glycosyltransferase involved in cell wall biosynthesis
MDLVDLAVTLRDKPSAVSHTGNQRGGSPSVTVLVTVKNSANTIEKCIDSLLDLDYPDFRVYVTDAYSTDGTWEKLQQYTGRIRLERIRENIAAAHNYMITQVETPMIAFTDADCYVAKDWLRNLVRSFSSEEVVAVGGYCGTAPNPNRLHTCIGAELEERFRRFPRFVNRLPTMNLAVHVSVAREVPFDERLDAGQEAEWGARVNRIGKMVYTPDAKVWHLHRTSWRAFFHQQFQYGRAMPLLIRNHPRAALGDYISTPGMAGQLILITSLEISVLVTLAFRSTWFVPSILLIALIYWFLRSTIRLSRSPSEWFTFLGIFLVRTVAWELGILVGTLNILYMKDGPLSRK